MIIFIGISSSVIFIAAVSFAILFISYKKRLHSHPAITTNYSFSNVRLRFNRIPRRDEQLLKDYFKTQLKQSNSFHLNKTTLYTNDLLEKTEELLVQLDTERPLFLNSFENLLLAKCPQLTGPVPIKTVIHSPQLWGQAIIFTLSGYALAKASRDLLGTNVFLKTLSPSILSKWKNRRSESGYAIDDDLNLIRASNPIDWSMVRNILVLLIYKNKTWLQLVAPQYSRVDFPEHFIEQLVMIGYYFGLKEIILDGFQLKSATSLA